MRGYLNGPPGLILLVLFSAGCDFHPLLAPASFPKTQVQGRVTMAGRPIGHGWLTLFPVDNTLGDPVIVPFDSDGRFSANDAPVGLVAVRAALPKSLMNEIRVANPPLASRLAVLASNRSPIRFDTNSPQSSDWLIDLASVPLTSP